jgi:hypothetical protein
MWAVSVGSVLTLLNCTVPTSPSTGAPPVQNNNPATGGSGGSTQPVNEGTGPINGQGGGVNAGGGAGGGTGGVYLPDEICDNGLDDDGNKSVDDGCACDHGEVQSCFLGRAVQRKVGICRDGFQVCTDGKWGSACTASIEPRDEIDGNRQDDDCDGRIDETPSNNNPTDCKRSEFGWVCLDGGTGSGGGGGGGNGGGFGGGSGAGNGGGNGGGGGSYNQPDCRRTEFGWICEDGGVTLRDGGTPSLNDCVHSEFGWTCPDGGTFARPDGGWSCSANPDTAPGCKCDCIPGAVRWCDETTYCAWAKQTCNAQGKWGACTETTERPKGCSSDRTYDWDCCIAAGECCQDPYTNGSWGQCINVCKMN